MKFVLSLQTTVCKSQLDFKDHVYKTTKYKWSNSINLQEYSPCFEVLTWGSDSHYTVQGWKRTKNESRGKWKDSAWKFTDGKRARVAMCAKQATASKTVKLFFWRSSFPIYCRIYCHFLSYLLTPFSANQLTVVCNCWRGSFCRRKTSRKNLFVRVHIRKRFLVPYPRLK